MIGYTQLNSWLDKSMQEICLNNYVSADHNHCAHFVAHVLNIHRGYTCKHATGGSAAGANLRVHEIFSYCSNQQEIVQSSDEQTGLIFVSGRGNFVTDNGVTRLNNVPKKHIGILYQGFVWHFSNKRHKVVKQAMSDFLQHYPGQENALWFAEPPSGSRAISFRQC